MTHIVPVILSGGSGSRLWPKSRSRYPKQLQALISDRSMLIETAARVGEADGFAKPIVICNEDHRFLISEQFRAAGVEADVPALGRLIIEPMARNTAPAIVAGALVAMEQDADAMILVLPADHLIRDIDAFHHAIATGAEAAATGKIVTFGITPDRPETGYGYIQAGDKLATDGAFHLKEFKEKPDAETAQRYLDSGDYFWNGGIFLTRASTLIEEIGRFEPDMLEAVSAAVNNGQSDPDFFRLNADDFGRATSISIDYAVMERTDRAATVPVDMGWSDVGAWSELWSVSEKDADGNVTIGDVVPVNTTNSYIRADHGLVTTAGVKDLVIVATADAVLVCGRHNTQDVKLIVDRLQADSRTEIDDHKAD